MHRQRIWQVVCAFGYARSKKFAIHKHGSREKPVLLLLCANRANLPRSTTDWQNSAGAPGALRTQFKKLRVGGEKTTATFTGTPALCWLP